MLRFALSRILSAAVTLFGVSVLVFIAVRLVPGSFEEVVLPRGSDELRAQVAERLGLDQPILVQYWLWISDFVRGDFGTSLLTGGPVWEEFAPRILVTGELALLALLMSLVFGGALGVAAGFSRRPAAQTSSRLFSAATMSVPDFVIGSIFLWVFSVYALGFTVGEWVPWSEGAGAHLRSAFIPALTLAIFGIGLISATVRLSILAVLEQDHITAARLRGLSEGQILRRHVFRNAAISILTVTAIFAGYLLGGAVLVEFLFSVPGLGRYVLQGILQRDYVVVQAGVMLAAFLFVLINMAADLAYAWLDPRLRAGGA
jgi:peptide/nickel transport system permease protein